MPRFSNRHLKVPEVVMNPDVGIVVATRNRVQALEMSLPLMLKQTLLPKEIFVVDSSDDPEPIKALVEDLAEKTDVPIQYVPSAPGLTKQRNVGLARITCPVVAFPDDDSLMFETYVEEIARVYAADQGEALVGVTVVGAKTSPLANPDAATLGLPVETYRPKSSGRVIDALGRLYVWTERKIVPIPYVYLRRGIQHGMGRTLPPAVEELGCSLVAEQEGFRMSFRTEPLRKAPFNECLTGYSLGEDIDVCYGLAEIGMIARLEKALIYHHEFPGARANGYQRGVMQPINIAYIAARHSEQGHRARKAIRPWLWFLMLQSCLRFGSAYQRERLKGMLAARRRIGRLITTPREKADEAYLSIMGEL